MDVDNEYPDLTLVHLELHIRKQTGQTIVADRDPKFSAQSGSDVEPIKLFVKKR